MTPNVACDSCERRTGYTTCEAFPEKIPEPMLMGENQHLEPYKGDNGLTYKNALYEKRKSAEGRGAPKAKPYHERLGVPAWPTKGE